MDRWLWVLLFVSLLTGCMTTQSVPVDDRSRTIDAPPRVVLDAVIATLTVEGYPVDYVDRRSRLVSTGYKYERAFLDERRIRANAYVDGVGEGRTRLTLLLSLEDVDEHGKVSAETLRGSTARELYRELLDEVEARV